MVLKNWLVTGLTIFALAICPASAKADEEVIHLQNLCITKIAGYNYEISQKSPGMGSVMAIPEPNYGGGFGLISAQPKVLEISEADLLYTRADYITAHPGQRITMVGPKYKDWTLGLPLKAGQPVFIITVFKPDLKNKQRFLDAIKLCE